MGDHKERASKAHDMFLKQVASRIDSQSDLARRLGLSRAYVSDVFKGGRRLSLNSIFKWADAVGLDVEIVVTPRPAAASVGPSGCGAVTTNKSQGTINQVLKRVDAALQKRLDKDCATKYDVSGCYPSRRGTPW